MARTFRRHLPPGSPEMADPLAPKHLTKIELARRLYSAMIRKGWTQSELARRSELNREAVSSYVRGRTYPGPVPLQKMADALGCTVADLLPNEVEAAIDHDMPSLEMKVSPAAPTKAWLRVNRLVSLPTAARVISLIEEDTVSAAEAKRSS